MLRRWEGAHHTIQPHVPASAWHYVTVSSCKFLSCRIIHFKCQSSNITSGTMVKISFHWASWLHCIQNICIFPTNPREISNIICQIPRLPSTDWARSLALWSSHKDVRWQRLSSSLHLTLWCWWLLVVSIKHFWPSSQLNIQSVLSSYSFNSRDIYSQTPPPLHFI